MTLKTLLNKVEGCTLCARHLPLGPRPVVRISETARLLIIGQAPGTKVHESGIPWNDRSGDRLREWLNLDKETFYDVSQIAIMPMGFCYPGTNSAGGDNPPRPECAPLWHAKLRHYMPNIQLTLLVGRYAHQYYLRDKNKVTLTETVQNFKHYLPDFIPLPHPSWRNTAWLKQNSWFEISLLKELRKRIKNILEG